MLMGETNGQKIGARGSQSLRRFALFGLRLLGLAGFLVLSNAHQSYATNMQFGANVTPSNSCAMILRRDGDLGVSADKKTLSSKITGGLSGIVDVFSFGGFDVYADAPVGFTTAPAGGNAGVDMEARFSGIDIFRGRTFSERDGSIPETLRSGVSITRLNVHLTGTRPTEFPGGDYVGFVIVRCE